MHQRGAKRRGDYPNDGYVVVLNPGRPPLRHRLGPLPRQGHIDHQRRGWRREGDGKDEDTCIWSWVSS